MVTTIEIGSYKIGANHPCFLIAEAGVNHNGDLKLAHQLIDAAKECGADAIKFQTFKAENLVTAAAPKADYQLQTTSATESQLEMLRRLELDAEAHCALLSHCRDQGILFLSTPFDEASADLLDSLGVPAYKTPSGEITNLAFLDQVARKGKPMLVSTGMAFLGEVEAAVRTIEATGNERLALLHCVSNYPADPADVNLRAMHTMRTAFRIPVGYSDHTLGIEVSLAAVALGACVIEKHFTLDRHLPGPDHRASLEPSEFAGLARGIRLVEAALGSGRKEPAANESSTSMAARKSLVAAQDIPAGTILTQAHIAIKRPGTGLAPSMRDFVLGRKARVTIRAESLLTMDLFE